MTFANINGHNDQSLLRLFKSIVYEVRSSQNQMAENTILQECCRI